MPVTLPVGPVMSPSKRQRSGSARSSTRTVVSYAPLMADSHIMNMPWYSSGDTCSSRWQPGIRLASSAGSKMCGQTSTRVASSVYEPLTFIATIRRSSTFSAKSGF